MKIFVLIPVLLCVFKIGLSQKISNFNVKYVDKEISTPYRIGCADKKLKIINISELTDYPITQRQTEITLIKSFIINKDCHKQKKDKFSDVFVAKVRNTNDTILIFSICRKTYPFLKNEYKGPRWLVLDSGKITKNFRSSVITTIDKSIMVKKYKIIVSEINNLED
jgi:hypothetical protein